MSRQRPRVARRARQGRFGLFGLIHSWHTPLHRRGIRYASSEVEAALEAEHDGIGVLARPTRPDDVLQVELEEECIPEKPQAIGPLQRHLIALHTDRWVELLGAPLRVLQVVAEVTVNNAKTPHVRRPRGKDATDQEASGEEVGHLADGLIGRDDERAGDAETAVAAWLPKADQHLVEQAVEAPAAARHVRSLAASGGGEVGEAAVVVPEASLVVAEEACVTRQAVALVSNLRDSEQRSVQREVNAVVRVGTDGGIAVIHAAHDVRPCRRSHLDARAPGGVGVGGHARSVEENADRIAIEAVLDKHVVIRRNEEVVPSGDAADAELDAVVEQRLLVGQVDDPIGLAAEDLLDGEDVADVFLRWAGAEAL